MIKALVTISLISTNLVSFLPHKPPSRPVEIGIQIPAAAEQLKPLEPIKLPEHIKEIEPIEITVQGKGNTNNTYAWGNCTWYVANNKTVPDSWGNARTWLPRAQQQGYSTGEEPKVGAIAWFPPGRSLGHVALVKAINPDDGTILISEMNSKGLNVVSERIINANEVEYIY